MIEFSEKGGFLSFEVRVVPRASRTEIVGTVGGAVKVRVASPPVDGAANRELISLFAKKLGVAKADIEIVSGQTSKTKRMTVYGGSASRLKAIVG